MSTLGGAYHWNGFDAFLSVVLNEYFGKVDDMVRIYDNPLKEFGICVRMLLFALYCESRGTSPTIKLMSK